MLGPSPQGRLEISTIRTPKARRDTGAFNFEIYQDKAYNHRIAQIGIDGYIITKQDLAPGAVTIQYVRPSKYGVQLFTDIRIAFTTEHTMYTPAMITIEFPPSITLPTTGATVTINA